MNELLAFALLGLLPGVALGASLTLAIAHWRGMFNPRVTVSVIGHAEAPITEAARISDHQVLVKPTILVTLEVIEKCANGAGLAVVSKELLPPLH